MVIVRAAHLCDYVDFNLTREGFSLSLLSFLEPKKKEKRKPKKQTNSSLASCILWMGCCSLYVVFSASIGWVQLQLLLLSPRNDGMPLSFLQASSALWTFFSFHRVKDYANRVKSSLPPRSTNLKPKNKYIPRRVSVVHIPWKWAPFVCIELSPGYPCFDLQIKEYYTPYKNIIYFP